MDDTKALSYFSSLSHISRQIATQEKSLIKYLGNKWEEYTSGQQEELLNDLFVPQFIRDLQSACADDESEDLPPYWPTLKLASGEKIIVDENDIWTWRDEHSGPFSWKSRSQQDLTLLDFEPDNLTKPPAKGRKSESSEEPPSEPPYQPFPSNAESWTQAVLDDYRENAVDVPSPIHSPSHSTSTAGSPSEEINKAFEASCEDLSPSASPTHTEKETEETKPSPQSNIEHEADVHTGKGKSNKGRKSPSPKKTLRSGSFKKEGKGKSAGDTGLLIDNAKEEGTNAFCNPALETDAGWSSFVGQKSTEGGEKALGASVAGYVPGSANAESIRRSKDKSSTEMSKNQASTTLPDRPKNQPSTLPTNPKSSRSLPPPPPPPTTNPPKPAAPVPQNPQVTEPVSMVMDRGSGRGGDESVESTPDHTTQLLKLSAEKVQEAEKEEVLYVVDDGEEISMSTQLTATASESSSSLNIPKTGFDFLDNW